jgi:hypothetical protein
MIQHIPCQNAAAKASTPDQHAAGRSFSPSHLNKPINSAWGPVTLRYRKPNPRSAESIKGEAERGKQGASPPHKPHSSTPSGNNARETAETNKLATRIRHPISGRPNRRPAARTRRDGEHETSVPNNDRSEVVGIESRIGEPYVPSRNRGSDSGRPLPSHLPGGFRRPGRLLFLSPTRPVCPLAAVGFVGTPRRPQQVRGRGSSGEKGRRRSWRPGRRERRDRRSQGAGR